MKNTNSLKITKRAVDQAQPREKQYIIWDMEIKGFGLRISPKGTKTYFIRYRPNHGGRETTAKDYTIGRHGVLTSEQARDEAKNLFADILQGKDPQQRKTDNRKEMIISELCDLYLQDGVATKKASTIRSDISRISRYIKPLLGKKRVSSLTSNDVKQFMSDVSIGKDGLKGSQKSISLPLKGGKGGASRTVGLLGGIFTFAIERNICTSNPVYGVKRFPDNKKDRFLNEAEILQLGEALSSHKVNPKAVNIIKILFLTGARKGEVEKLEWQDIDFHQNFIHFKDTKTVPRKISISQEVANILNSIEKTECSYVFPSDKYGKKSNLKNEFFVGVPKIWLGIRNKVGLKGVRLHDLRHTYASKALVEGVNLPIMGKMLGHKDIKTTMRYAHLADQDLKNNTNVVAGALANIMNTNKY